MTNIGIIGGGQLGRMLALAGYPLGLSFCCLEPSANSPMGQVARQICANYDDAAALLALAEQSDLITYEFENVPVNAARLLAQRLPVYPPPQALEVSQDRVHEKRCFARLGIPTPAFVEVATADDLSNAIGQTSLPCVLKTRRFGYDGNGQWVLRTQRDVNAAKVELRQHPSSTGYILEAFVPFQRELSIIAARSTTGELAFYPLTQNEHREGILRLSRAPSSQAPQTLAEDYAARVLNDLDYVGVLAIEFFEKEGALIANEMAPRVHNSGHWTQDGAATSQFENHLRAICGLPLGSTQVRGYAAMVNLIGDLPNVSAMLRVPGTHVHLYGKSPRPGRKLGHVNVVADDAGELVRLVEAIKTLEGI
jgi:5-(carboxyamino)imidazole ribonucleotide synthase